MASHPYFDFVLVELALYLAYIRINVPGGRHRLLVYATAGRAAPYICGPMEEFKWRIQCVVDQGKAQMKLLWEGVQENRE
jgi:hypothetical protein